MKTSMTSKQKRNIRRLLTDLLDEMGFSKNRAKKVLGNGNRFKAEVENVLNKLCASDLLELVGTATVPAVPTFKAKEHFKDDRSGPVKIGLIGDNFRKAFLASGMIEVAVKETTLRIHKLMRASADTSILNELGKKVADTTLGQMYEMMKAQGQGQRGILLTNGYANIFYVRDQANDTLWAVICSWASRRRSWEINANPVTAPDMWYANRQVLSR